MKNFATVALVLSVLATVASAQVTMPTFYSVVPLWLQSYFNAQDTYLIGFFWKYIMYGTFYVLMDQVYCRFLNDVLNSTLAGLDVNILQPVLTSGLTGDDAIAACQEGFWYFYDAMFYEGGPQNALLPLDASP
jgi:hypothetical protein